MFSIVFAVVIDRCKNRKPVKIVPVMIYNVFGGTLNLAQSINQS